MYVLSSTTTANLSSLNILNVKSKLNNIHSHTHVALGLVKCPGIKCYLLNKQHIHGNQYTDNWQSCGNYIQKLIFFLEEL
jgi:hypothetical protein